MSNPKGNIKHGLHGALTYSRWKSMMARCYQANASNYKYYGAKGITVWEPWRTSFATFLADMGECPCKDMTVERLDNEIGYRPDNCIWATKADQNKHRSHCVPLTYSGRTMNLSDWAVEINISTNALAMRIRLGWSVERALTQPLKKRKSK
jgi:hypothetical protein